jgi:apolipoprotein N-acyltransferase
VKPRTRIALAAAYAVCTFLSFPHPLGERVIDLGAGLAWLGPAFLLLMLRESTPLRAARWAFLASLVAHTAVLHWIYVVTVVYGYAPVIVGALAPALLGAYIASFSGVFGAAYTWITRSGLGSPLAAALLWTALDHARSVALSGFPWATLGYAQHANSALLGLAPLAGVYGLSWVTVLGGAALAELALAVRRGSRPGVGTWIGLGLVAGALAVGAASVRFRAAPGGESVRVAVLQGNIDQGVKWSPEWAHRTLEIYEDLTRRAAAQGATLVVWPETAVPGSIEWDVHLRGRVQMLAGEVGATLVVGGVGLTLDGESRPTAYFDSAFVVAASGELLDRYDKTHLVPFGEYLPLQELLGVVFRALARGIAESSVTAGDAPRALEFAVPGAGVLRAGVPICYELLFPDLVRHFAYDGAQLLLAITNDAWYGRTGAPYQFLAMTALRAAETGLWTARAANTGVSAFIDARGRVHAQTGIFERALLVADVPLASRSDRMTFYALHGDWFAGGCWIGAFALLGAAGLRARRGRGPCAKGADE